MKPTEVFEKEILPHENALFGLAMKLTRDRDAAEDLLQDTLLRAYRKIELYEPGTDAKSWAFLMMKRVWLNQVTALQKMHERKERLIVYEQAEPISRDAYFEEELHSSILRSIQDLPDEWARAVILSDLWGLEKQEIAERIDCAVGTAMSRVFRARQYLRVVLASYAWKNYGIKVQHRKHYGKKQKNRTRKKVSG